MIGGSLSDSFRKVEIIIACRSLRDTDVFSKSDPRVIFKMKHPQTGQWIEMGRTETIQNNLNPNFKKSFTVDYTFEVKQDCYFEVQDEDDGNSFDHLGECYTTIGAIVGARNNTLVLDLMDKNTKRKAGKSKIIFIADNVSDCNSFLFTQWKGIKLMNTDGWFSKSDPFLRFRRTRQDNTLFTIHETEWIKDNLNPVWKPCELSCAKLNGGDMFRPVKVECWDWEKNEKFQFIGECTFTVDELIKGKRDFELKNPKEKKPGKLQLAQFAYVEKPSFLDYIRGNTQLNFILAVDFTASNGAVSTPESLHHLHPQIMNQYQKAIMGVSEILLDYDSDKSVPCYGFGGVPRYPGLTFPNAQHCFPMSGNPTNTEAKGLNEIMNLYSYSLQHVSLSGPTYFNPIVQETMKIATACKQQGSQVYSVLLILTDGEIHDMNETIDSLVFASDLPLSIIIVGVGNAEFGNMERLDGDQVSLIDSRGRKSTRDIVQFVPFRNFSGNVIQLAKEVLFEIPTQLVSYMMQQGIKPQPAPLVNVSQVQYQSVNPVQNLAQGMNAFLAPHINSVLNQQMQPQTGQGFPPGPPAGQGFPQEPQGGQGFPQAPQGGQGFPQAPQGGQGFPQAPQGGQGFPQANSGGQGFPQAPDGQQGFPQAPQGGQGFPQAQPIKIGFLQALRSGQAQPSQGFPQQMGGSMQHLQQPADNNQGFQYLTNYQAPPPPANDPNQPQNLMPAPQVTMAHSVYSGPTQQQQQPPFNQNMNYSVPHPKYP